ncbi:TIR-like protein FxsC [Phytohabitans sp. LJ34]|uniref:TIR-like protein FxsC n=1 Tax=Phytohabitans sp. LJ34 TaxID=3452217 RepID=UPI003F887C60
MPNNRATSRLRYFVSYAHDSGPDDELVQKFHNDLSHDVRLHSGWSDDRIGFCDSTLRAGQRWSPALVEALCTCQVFLALCSHHYFERPACGKEWTIFARRMAKAPARVAGHPASLVPLLWVVPTGFPPVAAHYQYRDATFGDEYHVQGLRKLMLLRKNHDAYYNFVSGLALHVVELNKRYEIPPERGRPAFDDIEPAFPDGGDDGIAPAGGSRPPRGPRPSGGPPRRSRPPAPPNNMPRLNPIPPDHSGGDSR